MSQNTPELYGEIGATSGRALRCAIAVYGDNEHRQNVSTETTGKVAKIVVCGAIPCQRATK